MECKMALITEKFLVGIPLEMSLSADKTPQLWQSFMPRLNEILNRANKDLISMQVYDKNLDFDNFTPQTPFKKWAAVEVNHPLNVPIGMQKHDLNGGLYAVFLYKGSSSNFAQPYDYIFRTWLPNSGYQLDQRPHFEILGEKYKNNSLDSEEEIWIPVK
jgi:AraC family transcriptional regulator